MLTLYFFFGHLLAYYNSGEASLQPNYFWVNHQNWSGVVNFHCIQVSLVMSMGFIFGCLNRGP